MKLVYHANRTYCITIAIAIDYDFLCHQKRDEEREKIPSTTSVSTITIIIISIHIVIVSLHTRCTFSQPEYAYRFWCVQCVRILRKCQQHTRFPSIFPTLRQFRSDAATMSGVRRTRYPCSSEQMFSRLSALAHAKSGANARSVTERGGMGGSELKQVAHHDDDMRRQRRRHIQQGNTNTELLHSLGSCVYNVFLCLHSYTLCAPALGDFDLTSCVRNADMVIRRDFWRVAARAGQ